MAPRGPRPLPLAAMFCRVGVVVGVGVPPALLPPPAGMTVTDVIVLGLPSARVTVNTIWEVIGAPLDGEAEAWDVFVDVDSAEVALEVVCPDDVLEPELWVKELVGVKEASGV
jgi:hypothetical protein